MNEKVEALVERMAEKLYAHRAAHVVWVELRNRIQDDWRGFVRELLRSEKDLCLKSEKQFIPTNPFGGGYSKSKADIYEMAQDDMLKFGFAKYIRVADYLESEK
jgi:hypothetical protein